MLKVGVFLFKKLGIEKDKKMMYNFIVRRFWRGKCLQTIF